MRIIQSLNQNALLVANEGVEEIVIGKGIGFGKKKGDVVNKNLIDKTYRMNAQQFSRDEDYYTDINEASLQMAEEVADLSEPIIGKKLSGNFILSLASHLQFCEIKYQDAIEIPEPFNYELKYLYPTEHTAAIEALAYLRKKHQLILPAAELSFFTLHFVNGLAESESVKDVVELSNILNEMIELIEAESESKLNRETIEFSRFVVHLRYFVIRNISLKDASRQGDNDMDKVFNLSFETFLKEKKIIEKLKQMLFEEHGLQFGKAEDFYLLLHLVRILKDERREKSEF
ncbi:CAT RNA binding domain-containing protein [Amphibacillus sp. Q70]|uniref:CAT RNA binding domain-containing protein n=1 Tax=Amphibacillus sp. Q70 TaxID=3453416 RepID=UPI003F84E6C5